MSERQRYLIKPERRKRRKSVSEQLQHIAPQGTPVTELQWLTHLYETKASAYREVLLEATKKRRPTVKRVIFEVKQLEREVEYMKAVLTNRIGKEKDC